MIRELILAAFVPSISAVPCVPPVIPQTETGDDLYRALLCDLKIVENAAATIGTAAQNGCTKFENLDFFTQVLVTITADNTWLDKLAAGGYPSGDECVGTNLRIGFDLDTIQGKADTPIETPVCPPVSGSALSQYTLQQFARTLTALANAPPGPTSPGPWQKYAQDLQNGMKAVRDVAKANNVAGCVAATQVISNSLVGIRSSCTTTPTTPTTTTTTPATTTTATTPASTAKPY